MNFGSDAFFCHLKKCVLDESHDLYNNVYEVVKAYTIKYLNKRGITSANNILYKDIDDIIQDIQHTVFINLVSFIKKSGDRTEQERNAWLNTIIRRKVVDCFRKKNNNVFYADDELLNCIPDNEAQTPKTFTEENKKLCELIAFICSINTTPDKIIAFLYNKIICLCSSTKKKSGSPAIIESELTDVPLGVAANIVKDKLRVSLHINIPDEIFIGLDKKLESESKGIIYKNKLFKLDKRTITDSSNKINTKIKDEFDINNNSLIRRN